MSKTENFISIKLQCSLIYFQLLALTFGELGSVQLKLVLGMPSKKTSPRVLGSCDELEWHYHL